MNAIRDVTEPTEPVLIVAGATGGTTHAIAQVCGFLGIRVERLQANEGIADTLYATRPIAALAVAGEIDCALYDLLMAVAGYDADLPVLIATNGSDSTAGAVQAARRLWQLNGLTHLSRAIETRDLIDFLFEAGRKSDTGRLLPV
jgi:hypothetical protein